MLQLFAGMLASKLSQCLHKPGVVRADSEEGTEKPKVPRPPAGRTTK